MEPWLRPSGPKCDNRPLIMYLFWKQKASLLTRHFQTRSPQCHRLPFFIHCLYEHRHEITSIAPGPKITMLPAAMAIHVVLLVAAHRWIVSCERICLEHTLFRNMYPWVALAIKHRSQGNLEHNVLLLGLKPLSDQAHKLHTWNTFGQRWALLHTDCMLR